MKWLHNNQHREKSLEALSHIADPHKLNPILECALKERHPATAYSFKHEFDRGVRELIREIPQIDLQKYAVLQDVSSQVTVLIEYKECAANEKRTINLDMSEVRKLARAELQRRAAEKIT